jgi:hypothetical protein
MIPVILEYVLTGCFESLGKRLWLSRRSKTWLTKDEISNFRLFDGKRAPDRRPAR